MPIVLLEIGTEELPAAYIPPALTQLSQLATACLQHERIAYEAVHTWGTPRRIALYVTGMATLQAPAVREVRGPAVQTAFASNGEPTQAAIGFARSQGVPVSELRIKKTDSGEYIIAAFRDEGRPTVELLPEIFRSLIHGLNFPKSMRWADSTVRFARPIRWLVGLMDAEVVPLTIGEVTTGRYTRGHRFLAPGEVEIAAAADYRRIMEENHVLVVPEERHAAVQAQLEAIAHQDGATIVDDGSLLDATTFHLEYPTAVRCGFDERFLVLPVDVLRRVLRYEQQFFPLAAQDGQLLPSFIAVRNGDKAYLGTVRDGYEAVARAKLIDAMFFFEQDTQRPLAERVERLRGVVFQERLGTMHDKVMRMQTLAGILADALELPPADRELAQRAALLSKADLVSAMVVEHPELQGVMGGVYAQMSEEPARVATAISEHYRPRQAGDAIPSTTIGRVVGLADKLDTVVGGFAVGLIPTGSEDPYALRREALGIVRILAEANYRFALPTLFTQTLSTLHIEQPQPLEELTAALSSFFHQRVETLLTQAGYTIQLARAVMAVSNEVPADALRRAQAIQSQLQQPTFAVITRIAARVGNISRGVEDAVLEPERLTVPTERELYTRYQEIAPRAQFFAERGEFDALIPLLATLADAVDHFFSEVQVMAADPDVRRTRLTLVTQVSRLFTLLADFSQLG